MEKGTMALNLPVRFMCKIIDGLTVEAFCYAYATIDSSASFDAIISTFTSWIEDVDALTDGQIIFASIQALPALPGGIKTAPVSTSRVEQTGIINFLATGTSFRWAEAIPALSNGPTVVSGGKIVLTPGDPASNLINLMTGGSSIFEWTNANNQALTAFKDSLISFRKYNRQVATATYER